MGNIDNALPYCGYVSQGPSGLTYYPGTGLSEKYDNHFLESAISPAECAPLRQVKPKGASFETVDNQRNFFGTCGRRMWISHQIVR